MARSKGISMRHRMLAVLVIFIVCFGIVLGRLGFLQIAQYDYYRKKAINNQTSVIEIAPMRGSILDRNMTELAVSANVYMVVMSPVNFKDDDEKRKATAAALAQMLSLDEEAVYKKTKQNVRFTYVKRRIEKPEADQVRAYIKENKLQSILQVRDDVKRYYPYASFAAHVIGFTGTDNQGLAGVEECYDSYLAGTPGKIVTATDAVGMETTFDYEQYIEPVEGADVVLTIDQVIQHFAEKYLENAVIEHKVANRGVAIVMDVKTGEILAMAVKPDFDLNAPFAINDELVIEKIETLPESERGAARAKALQEMWRNKAITEQYEPGSTFKIFTAAMAIEEKLVNDTEHFFCQGYRIVAGRRINCARRTGHGSETFLEGLKNSCNPVFMDIAGRVGNSLFYKYVAAFGFREKTGINLQGEALGIFHKEENFNQVELATAAFGQTFKVTPLQLVAAVAGIVNGGEYMKPRIVSRIVDKDGNTVKEYPVEKVRQMVSRETSEKLCGMLEWIIANGSGNGYVKGFRVGGKTGTSEKRDKVDAHGNKSLRIGSFIGFAPANDPRIAVLVMLDEPMGGQTYGNLVAAPAAASIINDALTYLGVEPQYTEEELAALDKRVPNLVGKSADQAEKTLRSMKLNVKIIGGEGTVQYQLPQAGHSIPATGTVLLYTNDKKPESEVTVPDVKGRSAAQANALLINAGLNIRISGHNTGKPDVLAYSQTPEAGTKVKPGTVVTVVFRSVAAEEELAINDLDDLLAD